MLYIDAKYASMLQPRVRNFKQLKDYLWNFSCPVCGDSKKNKLKARAYIYRKKNDLFVKCHNCAYGSNIGNFIKFIDVGLYDAYALERFSQGTSVHNDHKAPDFFDQFKSEPQLEEKIIDSVLDTLRCIDDLKDDHPIRKYCLDRKIPIPSLKNLYYTSKFYDWVNNNVIFKFPDTSLDHPRLVIPFIDEHGRVIAIAGRSFGDEKPKYYTIKVKEDAPKLFGMERVDYSKTIHVVEGPIDSLFLPNCIAVAGSDFDTNEIQSIKSNVILIPDNEPRNKEIVKMVYKYIENDYRVVMFPDTVIEKDINEMILAGKTTTDIMSLINTNVYSGIEAQMRYAQWKKC
jgi:transcription elongation factor Elf1